VASSLGWTYSLAACGAKALLPAACAGAARGSAALQQTAGACYGICSFATCAVAATATATGVTLFFSGDEWRALDRFDGHPYCGRRNGEIPSTDIPNMDGEWGLM
jgi:hypothetical protein